MALLNKADFIGTHNIDTAEKRDFILRYSNNKGHQHFESMAIASGAANQPPLTLADMLQTYTLDAAAVEATLQNTPTGASGLRGHEFLTAVAIASSLATITITKASGTPADPAGITVSGFLPNGYSLAMDWTNDSTGNHTLLLLNTGVGIGGDQLTNWVAAAIAGQPSLSAGAGAEGKILVGPYPPDVTVTINSAGFA